jgi:hypothetical protein
MCSQLPNHLSCARHLVSKPERGRVPTAGPKALIRIQLKSTIE